MNDLPEYVKVIFGLCLILGVAVATTAVLVGFYSGLRWIVADLGEAWHGGHGIDEEEPS